MSVPPTLKLLRTALGDPAFSDYESVPRPPEAMFQSYRVTLPAKRFRGLPPDWSFAVLDSEVYRQRGSPHAAASREALQLVESKSYDDLLFLISAESSVHLYDDVVETQDGVFCLDAPNISRKEPLPTEGKLSPFVGALQRRGLAEQPLKVISPYLRNHPVDGWRFFGRKTELRRLVNDNENYIIMGARRMGKTSLMGEAARILQARGERVYYINVMECRTPDQAASAILLKLSPQAQSRAARHGQALGQRPLAVALHELTSRRKPTRLFLDELGYVIESTAPEVHVFLSMLRKYTQEGKLRVAISCFQEVLIRQQEEAAGPLVNFGTTLRMEPFSDADIDDMVFAPFELWKPLQSADRQKLKKIVSATIGHHPLFIQYFCKELLERITAHPADSLVDIALRLVNGDLAECFHDAVTQVFWQLPAALPKYLFLKRCMEAHAEGTELWQTEMDDDWLIRTLEHQLKLSGTTTARRAILDSLEIHGLCAGIGYNRARQRIAVPLVYRYYKEVEKDVGGLVRKLADDAKREQPVWRLEKI